MQMNLNRLGLATVLVCSSLQAQAVGRLADVTVIDRNSGVTLPVYTNKGEYWVAGAPGARYAIAIRNKLGERVMAVTSVDGINVVSGATAAWGQTGYVFDAHDNYQITGWRKSSSEVAAFEFAPASDSYAERTGRPNQVGVIGVAVFRERLPEPVALPTPYPSYRQERDSGHGRSERDVVRWTHFERASERPAEVVTIRYDSRENLVAAGIIYERSNRPPNPFPNSDRLSYVPDPPARRY